MHHLFTNTLNFKGSGYINTLYGQLNKQVDFIFIDKGVLNLKNNEKKIYFYAVFVNPINIKNIELKKIFFYICLGLKEKYNSLDVDIKLCTCFEDSLLWLSKATTLNNVQNYDIWVNLNSFFNDPEKGFDPVATLNSGTILRVVFSVEIKQVSSLNSYNLSDTAIFVNETAKRVVSWSHEWNPLILMANSDDEPGPNIWFSHISRKTTLKSERLNQSCFLHKHIINDIADEFFSYFSSERLIFMVHDYDFDCRFLDFYLIHEYSNMKYKEFKYRFPDKFLMVDEIFELPKSLKNFNMAEPLDILDKAEFENIQNCDINLDIYNLPKIEIRPNNFEFLNDALSTSYGPATNSSDPTLSWRSDADGKRHKFDVPYPDNPEYEDKAVVINPESGLPDPTQLKAKLMERYNKLVALGDQINYDPKTIPDWESVSDYIPEDIYIFVSSETKSRYKRVLEAFYSESLNEASKQLLFFRWNLTPEQMEQALLGESLDLSNYSKDSKPKLGETVINITDSDGYEFIPQEDYLDKFDTYYIIDKTPKPVYMKDVKDSKIEYSYYDNFFLPSFTAVNNYPDVYTSTDSGDVELNCSGCELDNKYFYIILPKERTLNDNTFEYLGLNEFGENVYRKQDQTKYRERDKMRTHWNTRNELYSMQLRLLSEKKNLDLIEASYVNSAAKFDNCYLYNVDLIDNVDKVDLLFYDNCGHCLSNNNNSIILNNVLEEQFLEFSSIDYYEDIYESVGGLFENKNSSLFGFYLKSFIPSYIFKGFRGLQNKFDFWFGTTLVYNSRLWNHGFRSLLDILYVGGGKKPKSMQTLLIESFLTNLEQIFIKNYNVFEKYNHNELILNFFKDDCTKCLAQRLYEKYSRILVTTYHESSFNISNFKLEPVKNFYSFHGQQLSKLSHEDIEDGLREYPTWSREDVIKYYRPPSLSVEFTVKSEYMETSDYECDIELDDNFICWIFDHQDSLDDIGIANILDPHFKSISKLDYLVEGKFYDNEAYTDFDYINFYKNRRLLVEMLYSKFFFLYKEYIKHKNSESAVNGDIGCSS